MTPFTLASFRNRFGIPGVISVIALVFAMFGGAYAASDDSGSGSKASASAKAKKGPRGPKGPKGDTGPAGPAGPAGAKGDKGDAGANGSNGSNGTSATTASFSGSKGSCVEGGIEVKSASPTTLVCNGEEGAPGLPGEPWTAGGALPPGETQTGTYLARLGDSEGATEESPVQVIAPISFALPVEGSYAAKYVEGSDADCPGVVSGVPTAEPGFLCVYEGLQSGSETASVLFLQNSGLVPGVSPTGTMLFFEAVGPSTWFGPWAVTAPE